MTSDRQREANRRNGARSQGPTTAAGKARSRHNATRHGLSRAVADFDNAPERQALERAATEQGYSPEAAQELADAILSHRRVMRAYFDVYTAPSESLEQKLTERGSVRRLTPGRIVRGWLPPAGEAASASWQQYLDLIMDGVQPGWVFEDTTLQTLQGLDRYVRRSASRIAKAAKLD